MCATPYGSWPSPITSERIAAGALRLGEPKLDRGRLYWLEGRAAEGGRQVVMSAGRGEACREETPAGVNVRSVVHEYGGGAYQIRAGRLVYTDFAERRIHVAGVGSAGEPGSAYADFEVSPDGRWLAAVEERPRDGREPENRIVALPLGEDGRPGPARIVADGSDFVSSPRFSADGGALAFVRWNHPHMPWDESQLCVVGWGRDGPASAPRAVAGGPGESIVQPRFSPDGILTYVSDRSGWWNLHQLRGDEGVAVCAREAEFAWPPWVFGLSQYAFIDERTVLACFHESGRDRLARLDVRTGVLAEIALPFAQLGGIQVEGGVACLYGASPERAFGIHRLDLGRGTLEEVRAGSSFEPDPDLLSAPEALEFASADGRTAHAYFYAPRNPAARAPSGERPPLLVKSHGGPTSAASAALDLRIQYWTSRGFAVVDVDYGGSTGYGRAYRERLRGQWGVIDVEDCVHAALGLAAAGRVDSERLAISGGSAGGYTTLCALTFHDVFAAGASHYGIGDLEALARDTHKFESRYLDGLVGPYPERRDLYVERSPIHFPERLSCPVIFFQGLEDRVVPPSQAVAMVEALASRGIRHAYVAFPGEQHGFRKAENICTALDGELYFYSGVFGFDVEIHPAAVKIVG